MAKKNSDSSGEKSADPAPDNCRALKKKSYARSRLWLNLPLRRCRVWLNSDAAPSRPFACVKYRPTSFERLSFSPFRVNMLETLRATPARIFIPAYCEIDARCTSTCSPSVHNPLKCSKKDPSHTSSGTHFSTENSHFGDSRFTTVS